MPIIKIIADRGPVAHLDADNGMGQLGSIKGMKLAISKAGQHGIGAVGVRNSNHNGTLAYYAEMASREGLIGFAATNGGAIMAPWGGAERRLGSNPLAYSFPGGEEPPVTFDMACSVVAWSKIAVQKAKGERIPVGWALDRDGKPTDDPQEAIEGLVLPVGEHKGFGLALGIDLLCGVLTGSASDGDTVIQWPKPNRLGHFFAAIDPTCFLPRDEFTARVDAEIRSMHSAALREGSERIWMPNELELNLKEQRLRTGIPMLRGVIDTLKALGHQMGMAEVGPGG
jgi:ureidoglycolate dehydrogenase (NAD+)